MKTAHGLIVRVDSALDELKNKGVVAGNIGIHKCYPLVNQGGLRSSVTNKGGVGG